MSDENPWAERYVALADPKVLRQKSHSNPTPLTGLEQMPLELAARQLEMSLDAVFYPTAQSISILQRLMGIAHAHCIVTYPDKKSFIRGIYSEEPPLPGFASPICFTGLGGVGKSSLIRAFRNIQIEDHVALVDDEHSPFQFSGPWSATIQARSSPKDVLRALANADGKPAELIKRCRKLGFRDGIPLILSDEFQFATGSGNASTQVTQMILSIGYIGLPNLFVANFSLLNRLLQRPEEEQQRLLSNVIILHPDHWSSADWMNTLNAQRLVAPNHFLFDPEEDAKELHNFSAGRKRAMAKLLIVAFRAVHHQGGIVDIASIRRAYHSSDYAAYKEQAEILIAQTIQNRPSRGRKDLWCPIPLEKTDMQMFLDDAMQARSERVAEAELAASLTARERQTIQKIQAVNGRLDKVQSSGTVVQLKKKLTAEELKQNSSWFWDQL